MDGVPVVVAIDVGREQRGVKTELAMKESGEIGVGQFDTGRVKYSEQFNAIARGNDHALGDAGYISQRACGFGQFIARDSDALAQLDGRGFVIDPYESERHGAPNLWTWLTRLAAHTPSMTTNTAPER